MRARPTVHVFCLFFLAILAACSSGEAPAPAKKPTERTLVIGLIPEQNIFNQMERYGPLMAYLRKKTGVRYELKVLPRYGNIIASFQSLELDGAFFGSFTYALAQKRLSLRVLARPENLQGVSTYHGLLLVRKDSGIQSVKEMKGKRLACVDRATTAGYLLPLAYFAEHGVADPRRYLKEIYFAGTHEAAIEDVLNRKADIAAAKNTVFERMAATDFHVNRILRVIAVSPSVPENALAVRGNLDGGLAEKIKSALLLMNQDPEGKAVLKDFGARRFVETRDQEYDPVFLYAKEAHIDLATYDYLND
ncbi:MAG: phosphate/phosphite/phosphonate ABC transporter substrate-binding protein [Verrucomicrobiota bacterium]